MLVLQSDNHNMENFRQALPEQIPSENIILKLGLLLQNIFLFEKSKKEIYKHDHNPTP